MRYVALIAASALLASTPAAPAFAADTGAKEKASEKMVCKRRLKTGTRFPSKTCRTAEQWDQIAEQNKRDASEMINRPMIETRRDQ